MSAGQNEAARWRARFGIGGAIEDSMPPPLDVAARCALAEEGMRKTAERAGFSPRHDMQEDIRRAVSDAREALDWLRDADPAEPAPPALAALEVVVAFDGSRPSYPLRQGAIDWDATFDASPWRATLEALGGLTSSFAACVGRLELNGAALGTASLVAPTLALTNRHVLQALARETEDSWLIHPGAGLDFGREDGGMASFDPRSITGVAFAGPDPIPAEGIDHGRLDLALLTLTPSTLPGDAGTRALAWGGVSSDDITDQRPAMAAIGYPTAPTAEHVPTAILARYERVLNQLLGGGGVKRLAPGNAFALADTPAGKPAWTLAHSATTLAGSSGSPLMAISIAQVRPRPTVAALHHGGVWADALRRNFAHVLDAARPARDTAAISLDEVLAKHGVTVATPDPA